MKQFAKRRQGGYSLVEVIIAVCLFGMLALAFSLTTISTRKAADSAVVESTAMTAASSYLEQLKSIDYENIVASVRDPGVPLPTLGKDGVADSLKLNQWNDKTIVLDRDTSGNVTRQMVVSIRPSVEDRSTVTGERLLNITISYRWNPPGQSTPLERTLRTARSFVPTF